jgi:hypothetical protein
MCSALASLIGALRDSSWEFSPLHAGLVSAKHHDTNMNCRTRAISSRCIAAGSVAVPVERLSHNCHPLEIMEGLYRAAMPRGNAASLGCCPGSILLGYKKLKRGTCSMPDSAVTTFTEPDAFHAAIRTAEVKCVVTARGDYRAELTRIELHHPRRRSLSAPHVCTGPLLTLRWREVDSNLRSLLGNVADPAGPSQRRDKALC